MSELNELPNIGIELVKKLKVVGIETPGQLAEIGSKNAIIRLSTLENSGACINMLYALEGAIQGIRWHSLSKEKKKELLDYFKTTIK